MQPALDPSRLVFVEETRATTNMSPTRGRARKGGRLIYAVPHGHWHTMTFLCGLRGSGLVASLVLDGAIDDPAFLAYVEQFLAPALSPSDVVVPDNLSSHKVTGVRDATEACGAALLYLPPYSPDLNSNEPAFLSSSACSKTQPNAPSRHCGRPSADCSTNSHRPSAPATFDTAASHSLDDNGLGAATALVVERMFGWRMRWRRLVPDYEKLIDVSHAMIHLSMGALLLQHAGRPEPKPFSNRV